MVADYQSMIVTEIAPAVANHLWQSTVCLALAGVLVLVMRRDRARVRYGVWLASLIKLLVPFSLLIALGIRLAPPRVQYVPVAADAFYIEMQQVSQPFTPGLKAWVREQGQPAQSSRLWWRVAPTLPSATVVIWLGGFLFVLARWGGRWWRVSKDVRSTSPLRAGREVEALRRIERLAGVRKPIEMRISRSFLEPGIFGIFRSVLVWPKGISGHLDGAELEAILAHELMHVRRRDNLAAALHMLVEAVFWFYPPVWWLGAQLVAERERACDEAVLGLGSERRIYAEGILKACEFCVQSPLACVAGVAGSDLKQRITRIMANRIARELNLTRRLMLVLAGALTLGVPLTCGLLQPSQSEGQTQAVGAATIPALKYDVADIRPNNSGEGPHIPSRIMNSPDDGRLYATNLSLTVLVCIAYGVQGFQVSGKPIWLDAAHYDIQAKSDGATDTALQRLDPDQRKEAKRLMLQALLADRFRLATHQTWKEGPAYALVVAKNGPRLEVAKDVVDNSDSQSSNNRPPKGTGIGVGRGQISGHATGLTLLANVLSSHVGRPVIDKTGLTGLYDFALHWNPDESAAPVPSGTFDGAEKPDTLSPDSSGPSIFTAIQEQLGLKLEPIKGPVDFIVIDHIERPSEN